MAGKWIIGGSKMDKTLIENGYQMEKVDWKIHKNWIGKGENWGENWQNRNYRWTKNT